jgi:hypothetical protein
VKFQFLHKKFMEHFPRKKINVWKYKWPHDTCRSWNKKVWSLAIWL